MTKLDTYLKTLERRYKRKPRVLWLHGWVLTDFLRYASLSTYEKALRAKKLSDNTVAARLFVVRRYLKAQGVNVPRRARA